MKKLGFGLMRLPLLPGGDTSQIDIEAVKQMVDLFMERGFTYFDTAYPYHGGKSEAAFRKAVVERYPREAYTVTDKLPCWEIHEEADLERIFSEQLERCGVDYFDYYWLHALNHDRVKDMARLGAWEFVARKKAEGKIRHIGFSFHDSSALLEELLRDHPEVECVQLQINYIDWEDASIEARRCYELCEAAGKSVIVMEPVKGGSLAHVPEQVEALFRAHNPEASNASWAVRYAASLPSVMMVLSGMSDLAQVDDNTSYMNDFVPFSDEERDIVEQAAHIIRGTIAIPCTACHYCTAGCPMQIAIPEYFAIYNSLYRYGEEQRGNTSTYFGVLAQSHGKPSDCLECGQCEGQCPQHISIIENLKKVAETFEQ